MILGIDESGRGPVIGDLVVAGVVLSSRRSQRTLTRNGVKDSKMLSRKRRDLLYPFIEKMSQRILTREITASEVDAWRDSGQSLNELEAKVFAEIIREVRPREAIVDCADVVPEMFETRIRRYLGKDVPKLVCEHFADKNHAVVSAASIVAKVTRDQGIRSLSERYGEMGSGYCSDKRTQAFLEDWYAGKGSFPCFVRKTWCTVARIRDRDRQRTLTDNFAL
jgi:ribonuclease HII